MWSSNNLRVIDITFSVIFILGYVSRLTIMSEIFYVHVHGDFHTRRENFCVRIEKSDDTLNPEIYSFIFIYFTQITHGARRVGKLMIICNLS